MTTEFTFFAFQDKKEVGPIDNLTSDLSSNDKSTKDNLKVLVKLRYRHLWVLFVLGRLIRKP